MEEFTGKEMGSITREGEEELGAEESICQIWGKVSGDVPVTSVIIEK